MQILEKENAVSKEELEAVHLTVVAAEHKKQLLRRISEVAFGGAANDLERATESHETGTGSSQAVEDARTRYEILQQILSTEASGEAGNEANKR